MSKNRLDFTAKLQRHSHNVTAGLTSSIAPSMILPQYFDYLQPGDSIYYRTHMFARFQDITTAFLGQVDLHIDYFFVPMQMLFTPFGSYFANTNDPISSFIDTTNVDSGALPYGNMQNYFTDVKFDELSSRQDIVGVSDVALKGAWRLLDHLDYNPLCIFWNQVNPPFKAFVPVGFYADLLAYQAIYQKFYRNDEFERFDVSAFNVDSFYADLQFSEVLMDKLLTLRYHGRPDDYFTNVRFSPIASSINALYISRNRNAVDGGNSQSLESMIKNVNDFLSGGFQSNAALPFTAAGATYINSKASYMNNAGASLTAYAKSSGSGVEYFNAQAIRATFALDKYFRVYGRAGKTYDDQILAHFGVKVPHDVKHDLTHLKHYHMVLQADPILSTADTENGALGQVGGNVQSQLDTDEEKFTAPVHGVFMAVAYVLTRPRYILTCNRLHLISDVSQFPMPEFDKLGAQPMYGFEFGRPSSSNELLWMNRYQEWKQKYNRASITYAHDYYPYYEANFFSPWVISRQPYFSVRDSSAAPSVSWFFEKPSALDCVMATKYNGEWSDEYGATPHLVCQTDPILTEYCCFAKKVSWMSPTGEPDL